MIMMAVIVQQAALKSVKTVHMILQIMALSVVILRGLSMALTVLH